MNENEDLKLVEFRRLVAEGFDEIDRGNYVDVSPENIESFINELDARRLHDKPSNQNSK